MARSYYEVGRGTFFESLSIGELFVMWVRYGDPLTSVFRKLTDFTYELVEDVSLTSPADQTPTSCKLPDDFKYETIVVYKVRKDHVHYHEIGYPSRD